MQAWARLTAGFRSATIVFTEAAADHLSKRKLLTQSTLIVKTEREKRHREKIQELFGLCILLRCP